jgi:hypothetical protein
MRTFAEIKDEVVVNVSLWDEELPQGDQFIEITGTPHIGIGFAYINGEFIEPEPSPTPPSGEIPTTEA